MRAHTADEAFLITRAQNSPEEQHRARVRRYLVLMAFRVPALILACIVYGATQNGLLALAVVALSIPLPWVAVLVANDRPARKRGEVAEYHYGHREAEPASLAAPGVVIDSEVADPPPPAPQRGLPDQRPTDG
ncbi:hypothetical protein GOARA_036_00820 [Gordonia araii NBRC 100433]|uniref:DUF3099 domain-containing protein n=1 Tax=Gordonia araii NBRC 100433 TaxID=1073574 RepID=G7H0H5_9ACTN|nr:DUF3099 domain-containing protein [Gordonia araii]NNG96887.1 DUF3099 domain-containing protein [Gordonia araii NBRC 100433]GAB09350.1 hypothetical protein GOARA_036_00820 [Gordonia araii NBRC 100433]